MRVRRLTFWVRLIWLQLRLGIRAAARLRYDDPNIAGQRALSQRGHRERELTVRYPTVGILHSTDFSKAF